MMTISYMEQRQDLTWNDDKILNGTTRTRFKMTIKSYIEQQQDSK